METDIVVRVTAGNIVEAMRSSNCETLRCVQVKLDHRTYRQIASLLTVHYSLISLQLLETGLDDYSAKLLSSALKANIFLQRLQLVGGHITSIGASSLSEALKVNHILGELDLTKNDIDDSGACDIADALRFNYTLHALFMDHNRLTAKTVSAFEELLFFNKTLCKLWLHPCKLRLSQDAQLKVNLGHFKMRLRESQKMLWKFLHACGYDGLLDFFLLNKMTDLAYFQYLERKAFHEMIDPSSYLLHVSRFDSTICGSLGMVDDVFNLLRVKSHTI